MAEGTTPRDHGSVPTQVFQCSLSAFNLAHFRLQGAVLCRFSLACKGPAVASPSSQLSGFELATPR